MLTYVMEIASTGLLAKATQPVASLFVCVAYLCVLVVCVCWLFVMFVCVCCCYALAGRSVAILCFRRMVEEWPLQCYQPFIPAQEEAATHHVWHHMIVKTI